MLCGLAVFKYTQYNAQPVSLSDARMPFVVDRQTGRIYLIANVDGLEGAVCVIIMSAFLALVRTADSSTATLEMLSLSLMHVYLCTCGGSSSCIVVNLLQSFPLQYRVFDGSAFSDVIVTVNVTYANVQPPVFMQVEHGINGPPENAQNDVFSYFLVTVSYLLVVRSCTSIGIVGC